jgi:hypothetical protein
MSLDSLRAGLVPRSRARRRRLATVVTTAVALAVTGAGLAAAVWARQTPPRVVRRAQTTETTGRVREASSTSTSMVSVRVWPTTTLPPVVVRAGDGTYAVEAGGFTAVGRFSCGGPLLAMVRQDGDAYLFRGWATTGADVVAALIGHVDEPRGARAEDADGDGCDEVVVDRAGSAPVTIRP